MDLPNSLLVREVQAPVPRLLRRLQQPPPLGRVVVVVDAQLFGVNVVEPDSQVPRVAQLGRVSILMPGTHSVFSNRELNFIGDKEEYQYWADGEQIEQNWPSNIVAIFRLSPISNKTIYLLVLSDTTVY